MPSSRLLKVEGWRFRGGWKWLVVTDLLEGFCGHWSFGGFYHGFEVMNLGFSTFPLEAEQVRGLGLRNPQP